MQYMVNYPGGRTYQQPKLPKSPMVVNSNAIRGLKSKRNGQRFEALIERSCNYYRKMGVAHIQKIPEPIRIIKKIDGEKGLFQAHFEKQAQPDFNGALKGGKMVVFEAKHETGKRISKRRLTREQVANFESYDKLNVICFILVSFDMKNYYKVPWSVWNDKSNKKKSFSQIELTEHEVHYNGSILDFLKEEGNINGKTNDTKK